ncbi:MAG: DUF2339 domain-containing protein [Sphingosinicella sp.]|uniref:DUF2339 domain-containing protein n=1 Tax=Sphingosinicella sp. TaxID=1917971 RepID=UPI0040380787
MELLLLILIGGGFALWISNRDLKARLDAIERRLEGSEAPASPASAGAPMEPEVPYTVTYQRREPARTAVPAETGVQDRAETPPPERVIEIGDEPEREREEPERERESVGALFERLVGGRLLIWLGGIALVVAAVYLIRYSIEIGLVTPAMRMAGAALFGLVLLGAGEASRWKMADDPRIDQVLVGAGIAVLYAAAYGSHSLYGLIGTGAASAAMLAITAVALGLSLRHGAPTAVMGLIGGFLTPALVGDSSSGPVPLLAYLGLLDLAIFLIAWRRGWTWLAAAAVALSFVWSAFLLFLEPEDALASGMFVILLAIGASLARPGDGRALGLIQPLLIGIVQLAFVAARSDLGFLGWLQFGALAAASLVLAALRKEYRAAPAVALAFGLLVLLGKAGVRTDPFVLHAAVALTMIFGLGGLALALALALRQPGRLWTAVAAGGFAGPLLVARAAWPALLDLPVWGAIAAGLALGPATLIWLARGWASASAPAELGLLTAGAAAALLLGAAIWDLAPGEWVVTGWMAVALLLTLAARRLGDLALATVAAATAAAAAARAVSLVPELSTAAITALIGLPALAVDLPTARDALFALALPAVLLTGVRLAMPELPLGARRALAPVAGLFALAAAYVWFKQGFGLASEEDFVARGFLERTILTQALFAAGWLFASGRLKLPRIEPAMLRLAGTALTALAAARLVWFDLVMHNPAFDAQWVGATPVLNLILPAYLLSAAWLYAARRRYKDAARSGFWLAAFLAALVAGAMLLVRQAFQGPILTGPELPIGEMYGYSAAGIVVALALLLGGVRLPDKALRLAGLILLTATMVKVFLVDASELEGVLRILSFLGLGVVLIGIGRLYGPILRAELGAGEPARGQAHG